MAFKEYCCSYRHNCAEWAFTISAESVEDAQARLKTIGAWGKVDGELMLKIPAATPIFLVRLLCWFKNF